MKLREALGDGRDQGWLVALAAVGNRSQQGAVSLDVESFERKRPRDVAQLGRVLEGENSRERDVEPAGQAVLRKRQVSGEAVDDASGALGPGVVKDPEDIVEGIDAAPAAFIGMMQGDNVGKRLVRVGDDPTLD